MNAEDLKIATGKLAEAAYPIQIKGKTGEGNPFHIQGLGLSKREWFAGMAMQGIISTMNSEASMTLSLAKSIAIDSIIVADELIEQLNDHDGQTSDKNTKTI